MSNHGEWQYLELMKDLINAGHYREGRNGHHTYSKFGAQMRFDLRQGFPLLTTKRVNFKAIVVELLWFLRGDTNVKYLHDHGVHIWDQWADENGDLGPVYGKQWRSWPVIETDTETIDREGWGSFNQEIVTRKESIDQLVNVIEGIKRDPYGRRHIVTAWNPAEIDDMALPPCHCLFQFHVADGKLNCQLYQRSADWMLGVPFNIGSYALLTHLVARETGLEPGEFVHSFGDYHLYSNHLDAAREQLRRTPIPFPDLVIRNAQWGGEKGIFDLEPDDIGLLNYEPCDPIKAEVAV